MKLSSIINEILEVLPTETKLAYSEKEIQAEILKEAIYLWIEQASQSKKGLYIGEDSGGQSWLFYTKGLGKIRIYEVVEIEAYTLEQKGADVGEMLETLSFIHSFEIGQKKYDESGEAFYLEISFKFSYPEIQKEG